MSQTFRDLKHCIGSTLQLQVSPSNKDERFYVKLIGFFENKSIIITSPRADGGLLKIEDKQKFIIRMMSGSSAQVFTCFAIFSTNRPYAHTHLTYPETLESITIRKAERVNCKLIVTVQKTQDISDEGISATLTDISTAGAQLFANAPLGTVGDSILIKTKFTVASIEQYLTISGLVRRAVNPPKDGEQYEYGIEFDSIEDKDKLILTAFVYEQMMTFS